MHQTPQTGGSTSLPPSSGTAVAYERLQARLLKSTSYPLVERYERALNELLRHPERVGDPQKIANAAYGNAGKVVRAHLKRTTPYDDPKHDTAAHDSGAGYAEVEWNSFVDSIWAAGRENTICHMLLRGYEVNEIAKTLGISEGNTNVMISRIRKTNRTAASGMSILPN